MRGPFWGIVFGALVVLGVLIVSWPSVGGDKPPRDETRSSETTGEKPEPRTYPAGSPVLVRVLDAAGRPVRSADVRVSWDKGLSRSGVDEHGEVRFPRTLDKSVLHVTHAVSADGVSLAPARRDLVGNEETIEMRLARAVAIAGHVTDATGKGVAGVRVHAVPEDDPKGPWLADAETSDDGAFRLAGLDAVTYELTLRPPGEWLAQVEIPVKGGEADVRIVLSKGEQAIVTVLDWQGHPLPGANVIVERRFLPSAEKVILQTDAEGKATLGGLDATRRVVWTVRPPDDREDVLSLEGEDEVVDAQETVTLARAYVVSGIVLDDRGAPARATVRAIVLGSGSVERESNPDGTFRIGGLPYGPVTLVALSGREFPVGGPPVEARPENPRVELRAGERAKTLRLVVAGMGSGRRGTLRREAREGEGEAGLVGTFVLGAGGSLEMKDVHPGAYTLWIPPIDGEETCVYAAGLAVPDGELRLDATRCLAIRVRLTLPADATAVQVDATGPLGSRIGSRDLGGGVHEIRGLPPGKWKVSAKARGSAAWLRASVDAEAGTEVELEPK